MMFPHKFHMMIRSKLLQIWHYSNKENTMKKVTSFVLAACASAIFASSAMAATTHQATEPTHHVKKQHSAATHHVPQHHKASTAQVSAQSKTATPVKPTAPLNKKEDSKAKA